MNDPRWISKSRQKIFCIYKVEHFFISNLKGLWRYIKESFEWSWCILAKQAIARSIYDASLFIYRGDWYACMLINSIMYSSSAEPNSILFFEEKKTDFEVKTSDIEHLYCFLRKLSMGAFGYYVTQKLAFLTPFPPPCNKS
jgi:hypothetical protein